jgi:hypothetical protein
MTRCDTIRRILPPAIIAVASAFAPAIHATERGAWFCYQSSDPNGAANVVGNSTKENEAIDFFKQWHVTRLYGSHSNLPTNSASTMAA